MATAAASESLANFSGGFFPWERGWGTCFWTAECRPFSGIAYLSHIYPMRRLQNKNPPQGSDGRADDVGRSAEGAVVPGPLAVLRDS